MHQIPLTDFGTRYAAAWSSQKGKMEFGVKFVKRNALAGRAFASFAALTQHLAQWMTNS